MNTLLKSLKKNPQTTIFNVITVYYDINIYIFSFKYLHYFHFIFFRVISNGLNKDFLYLHFLRNAETCNNREFDFLPNPAKCNSVCTNNHSIKNNFRTLGKFLLVVFHLVRYIEHLFCVIGEAIQLYDPFPNMHTFSKTGQFPLLLFLPEAQKLLCQNQVDKLHYPRV